MIHIYLLSELTCSFSQLYHVKASLSATNIDIKHIHCRIIIHATGFFMKNPYRFIIYRSQVVFFRLYPTRASLSAISIDITSVMPLASLRNLLFRKRTAYFSSKQKFRKTKLIAPFSNSFSRHTQQYLSQQNSPEISTTFIP